MGLSRAAIPACTAFVRRNKRKGLRIRLSEAVEEPDEVGKVDPAVAIIANAVTGPFGGGTTGTREPAVHPHGVKKDDQQVIHPAS